MHLTPDDIKEFCAVWKRDFNEEITPEYARQRATELLTLYRILWSELPKKETPVYLSKREEQDARAQKFLAEFTAREGRVPSVRELAKGLGLKSSRSGLLVRNRLIEQGLIKP